MLGPQFHTLYRGVRGTALNTNQMGQSWSTDKSVAERFANFDEEGYESSGYVITAKVHSRHIMTGPERRSIPDIHTTASYEREQPVRKGGIVHVQGVERIDETGEMTPVDPVALFGKRKTGRA